MKLSKTKKIADQDVVVQVAAGLESQAEWLLDVLDDLPRTSITEGAKIPIGWSLIALRRMGDGRMHVCEPDFGSDAPHTETLGASLTLHVLSSQLHLASAVGVEPLFPMCLEKIIFEKGCLTDPDLYLLREVPERSELDSGWFIGSRNRPRNVDVEYEAMHLYQLLFKLPQIMSALILPVGYMVAVRDGEIVSISDDEDNVVFPIS